MENVKEIIGVYHESESLGEVEKYLQKNYPEGIKSLLLEIAPIPEKLINSFKSQYPGASLELTDSFFSPLARKYEKKGTKIIEGDINRDPLRSGIFNMLKDLFGNSRDKGIEKVFRGELPEVTVLGASHSRKLKKSFPDIPYTFFSKNANSNFGTQVLNSYYAKRADKIIEID